MNEIDFIENFIKIKVGDTYQEIKLNKWQKLFIKELNKKKRNNIK